MTSRTLLLLAALGASASPALLIAQHDGGHAAAAKADSAAVPLYARALGAFSWPVSTASAEAQAYFDQGVKLVYAFDLPRARRSFQAARTRDPACAMCWWGEAWAMGPYLNGAMRPEDAPAAFAASRRAVELSAARARPVERALVEAMAVRYGETWPAEGRKGLDSAFAAAMEGVYAGFPDDPQVAALYADALMVLEPRRGTWPVDKPSVARIHQVLARALEANVGHPGVCHSYIHATETTPVAGGAQACADLLVNAMPGASHLNHMPSHTYNRVGRWNDAVQANVIAWASDRRAAAGDGISVYPTHNLHMLMFAASMDGQSARAVEAADAYAAITPSGDGASLQVMARIRFGRWDEVMALAAAPPHPVHRGLWAFGRGYAHLRLGHADSAAAYLARVDSFARNTPETVTFRGHGAPALLGIVGGILRAEILRGEGRLEDAITALEQAVALEDALVYDEPEPLPFAARDWLGAALLDAGRAADAERVYRAALDDRPQNGWSLFGLEQSLRAQGSTADADEARARFAQAWARSDVRLESTRF
jgi:tetratricopeptide (TPR) repeat protein